MDIDIADILIHLENDAIIRDKLKEEVGNFEKKIRIIMGTLNKIHSTPPDQAPLLIASVKPLLDKCRDDVASIAGCVPENQFWRWKEIWSKQLQSVVFAAAFFEFLDSGKLLSMPAARLLLGIDERWKDRLCLQVEDYLHGLITLVSELSRLSINLVTLGDFDGPFRISVFVRDLFTGFSMLNFKNDNLRRRFDSIKYDLKRIEEVVYDISLRRSQLGGYGNAPPNEATE